MPRLRSLAALACVLVVGTAAPAAASATGQAGVVLSTAHHNVRLVDRAHRVSKVHVRAARGLRCGQRVSIRNGRARVRGRVHRFAFLGRVVRSSARGTVLRLGDGSTFKLGKPAGHGRGARAAASAVTVDVQGLARGQALLITLSTDRQGTVVIAIKLLSDTTKIGDEQDPKAGQVGDEGGDDDPFDPGDDDWSDDGEEIDGTVTAIAGDLSSITVDPGDGSDVATIPVDDPELLDGIEVGDEVAVITDADGIAMEIDLLDFAEDPDPGDDDGDA
jgi:hypothetical protein